jgi:hypothetical protein
MRIVSSVARTRMLKLCLLIGMLLLPWCTMASCGDGLTDPAQVVNAQFAAYNAHDLESFAACYAENVSMVDLSGRSPAIQGMPALRKAFAYLSRNRNAPGVEIVNRIVNGPMVVDQERPLGPTHQPDVIAVYEVHDGKILNVWFPPSK